MKKQINKRRRPMPLGELVRRINADEARAKKILARERKAA